MKKKTIIVIQGPTAAGKTALAVRIAQHYQTSIVSADSRQCFRELDIGVAKPAAEQLNAVRHYFINSHSITDEVNASVFEQSALAAAEEIFDVKDLAVMAGGTGLYIRAFCEGIDYIPPVDPAIRKFILESYQEKGMEWLQGAIRKEDPLFHEFGEIQNPGRILRALEVFRSTGVSIRHYQQAKKAERPFNIIKFGVSLPRPVLYERINNRVNEMREMGLTEEVRTLFPYKQLHPLNTVGYSEIFEYFEGRCNENEAYELIKRNTRHYAKRQLTWFLKDLSIRWIDPRDADSIIDMVESSKEVG